MGTATGLGTLRGPGGKAGTPGGGRVGGIGQAQSFREGVGQRRHRRILVDQRRGQGDPETGAEPALQGDTHQRIHTELEESRRRIQGLALSQTDHPGGQRTDVFGQQIAPAFGR